MFGVWTAANYSTPPITDTGGGGGERSGTARVVAGEIERTRTGCKQDANVPGTWEFRQPERITGIAKDLHHGFYISWYPVPVRITRYRVPGT